MLQIGTTIEYMANELLDSTGDRLQWLRKRKRLTQAALARSVGVGSVYISQLESNTRSASRTLIAMLAHELGASRAFLEMETDDPTPPGAPMPEAPCYFCEEADAAAQAIDAMQHPALRRLALRLVLSVAEYMAADDAAPGDGGGVSAEEWRALEVLSPGRGKPRVIAKE